MSPASRSRRVTCSATPLAAAMNISSVTLRAPVAYTAIPIAGKTYTLFPWPGMKVRSPKRTGGYGLPLAKTARPFDHVYACSAGHSERDVGVEKGEMIGPAFRRGML